MDQFVSALLRTLPAGNCGCTVDWHRGDGEGHVVQWLWAAPVVVGAPTSEQVKAGVDAFESQSDFAPGDVANFHTTLPNAVETLESCPFQPNACLGEHIVASGSGLLRED